MINISKEFKCDIKELEKSLEDSLKIPRFKGFVDKLKIDKQILMKYTSSLEESSIEFDHCLNCNGLNECCNKLLGYAYLPKVSNNMINFSYKPCRYKNSQEKKYSYLKNVSLYNLPSSYQEASFANIDKKLPSRKDTLLWLGNFMKNTIGKGLYLSGNFGCGKTYLVVATFNELAKKGYKSAVIFWPEFLRNLKSSFSTNYEDKIEYIKNISLLLIDDIGAEAITSWARDEILCPILQHRMDNNLTTFFTSNLTIKELEEHLSQTKDGVEVVKARRIIERIKFLCEEMEIKGQNMRKK